MEMGYAPRPVHRVYIKSKLITVFFPVAVCPDLPIDGVAMLMGNDIAGGLVLPSLEVLDNPLNQTTPDSSDPGLYPACVVTCAQTRKDTDISIADSVLMSPFSSEDDAESKSNSMMLLLELVELEEPGPLWEKASIPMTSQHLSSAPQADETLQKCFKNVRLMRWALLLQEYNPNIQHKKGTENVLADGLSRLTSCDSTPSDWLPGSCRRHTPLDQQSMASQSEADEPHLFL
ncbi:uncharacterized protein LOC122820728 isoform X1 [Gambusia affinis]|uniref:uncharacterized protein LOC122820728 isoform X1 n=1 Tax=Gambusia affinis TaxID=33528 RepID=UPI001CDD694C|nr:uncharacterized protein LOC122820728 isoform X1 [Gambusia affinis]